MKKLYSDVSIVIPNWNGSNLLAKHLPDVVAAARGAQIVVADDHSTDESVRLLKEKFAAVERVVSTRHEGFASTVNLGVGRATGEVVVLLNSDVVPEKDFLSPLMVHFKDPMVFGVGCLEKSVEKGNIVLRGRGEAAWRRGFFVHWKGEATGTNTAWISGGSGAFRKKIWDRLGGMDRLYNPFYWEDIDISYRAQKAGYRLVFEPSSIVRHLHEEGKIAQVYASGAVNRIAYRNQFIFIWKNISDPWFLLTHIIWTPLHLFRAVMRGDIAMIVGYVAALLLLPQIIAQRMRSASFWRLSDKDVLKQDT